tara:strand:+ start:145 stop:513 length:369 start_codon:yes stop_codon:yes gene_type:complete
MKPIAIYFSVNNIVTGEIYLYREGTALMYLNGIGNIYRVKVGTGQWTIKPVNKLCFTYPTHPDEVFTSSNNWNTIECIETPLKAAMGFTMRLKQGDPVSVFDEIAFHNLPEWTQAFITEQRR